MGKNITIWGSGARRIQYIYINDVLKYLLAAKDACPGIYNLGGDEYLSMREVSSKLAEILDVENEFIMDKNEGEELAFMSSDLTKQFFKNIKMMTMEESLTEYLNVNIKNK